MLVDFNNIRRTNENPVPEIPFSRKTDVLVRDGRPFADFAALLGGGESSLTVKNQEQRGSAVSPVELLKQLL